MIALPLSDVSQVSSLLPLVFGYFFAILMSLIRENNSHIITIALVFHRDR